MPQLTVCIKNRLPAPVRCVFVFEGIRAAAVNDVAARGGVAFNDGRTATFPLARGLTSAAHELRAIEWTLVADARRVWTVTDESLVAVYVIIGYHDVCYEFEDRPTNGRVAVFLDPPPRPDVPHEPTCAEMYRFITKIARRTVETPVGIALPSTCHEGLPLGSLQLPHADGAEMSSRTGCISASQP